MRLGAVSRSKWCPERFRSCSVVMGPFRCSIQMTVSKRSEGHFHSRNGRSAEWSHHNRTGPQCLVRVNGLLTSFPPLIAREGTKNQSVLTLQQWKFRSRATDLRVRCTYVIPQSHKTHQEKMSLPALLYLGDRHRTKQKRMTLFVHLCYCPVFYSPLARKVQCKTVVHIEAE